MTEETHILVIFPHPDDETFSSAGTLAQYSDQGVPITYACLTLGQMGRNLGNPPMATRESLPHIREKELEKAAQAIGITDLRKMGLRDKTVEFEPHDEMDQMIQNLIDETNPSTIISFYPGYAVHPDHEATAESVVRTVERIDTHKRPKLHLVAFSNDAVEALGEPDIVNDISAYKTRKYHAFKAHQSQTGPFLEQLANPKANASGAPKEAEAFLTTETFWTYQFND
ncbi:bacillithiol biosynthesis deacetylase BshB2 [Staphylococcus felis]|uniref:bacillithiol biosynthesis deacetylase BshB2 n=1 Tax=Staphylococcus felis TaxID=46127 RepID=UPI0032DB968F